MKCSCGKGHAANFDLLANDFDIDGTLNRQSIVITQSPKSGTIRFNTNGTIVFTPDPTFLGIDTFRYTVRDNEGATSNQAVVTVNVSGQNLPPVAVDDAATTDREQPVTIDLIANDSDPEGQLVPGSIAITQSPAHGYRDREPGRFGRLSTGARVSWESIRSATRSATT